MTATQIAPVQIPRQDPATLGVLLWFAFGGSVEYIDGKRTVLPVSVSTEDLHAWFQELGLDDGLLPPQVRRIDKFRTVTTSARHRYEITGGRADLFIEEVAADTEQVVRHVMRRMTDVNRNTLSVEHVATLRFIRGGRSAKARRTTGDHWRYTILSKVKEPDRSEIEAFIAGIDVAYKDGAEALDPTAIRGIIRRYLLILDAVQLRSSGGIYFVPEGTASSHVPALSEVVRRINSPGCSFEYISYADSEHHRQILTEAFWAEVLDDCGTLSRSIDARIEQARTRGKLSTQHYADLRSRYDAILARADVYFYALGLRAGPAAAALEEVADKLIELNPLTFGK